MTRVLLVFLALASLFPATAYAAQGELSAPKLAPGQLPESLKPAPPPPAIAPEPVGRPATAPKTQTTPPANPDRPFANVPDAYFDEADGYRKRCESKTAMRQFYNCDCLAYEYLEERIRQPKASQSTISLAIGKKCADASEAAGYQYGQCLRNAPLMTTKIPIEEFCECFVNTYTRLFEESGRRPSSNTAVQYQTQAYVKCKKPQLAKKIFPYRPPVERK